MAGHSQSQSVTPKKLFLVTEITQKHTKAHKYTGFTGLFFHTARDGSGLKIRSQNPIESGPIRVDPTESDLGEKWKACFKLTV